MTHEIIGKTVVILKLKILITGTVTTNEMRHDFKLFIQFSLMHILFQPYSYYSTVRVLTSTLRNYDTW